MTPPLLPLLPPPANPYGRTAKELLGYTGKGGSGNNPGFTGGIPDENLRFNALPGFVVEVVDVPATDADFDLFNKNFYDTTPYTHVRIVVDKYGDGLDTMYLKPMFNLDPVGSPTAWQDCGIAGSPAALFLDQGDVPHKSQWHKLGPNAIGDVAWKVVIGGGDGATGVMLGAGALQFSQKLSPKPDRWYWRNGQPAVEPSFLQGALFYGDFWGNHIAPPVVWTTPTQADVRDNPGILLRQINVSGGVDKTDCYYAPEGHNDPSGVIHRFVGAPLAAQTIPACVIRHYFVGTAPSATGTGFLMLVLSLYRPGVGVVGVWNSNAKHFRFTPTVREVAHVLPVDVPCLAGDRFVIDLIGNFDLANGFLNEANSPIWIDYNGGVEDLAIDSQTSLGNHASYTEFPLLQYITPIP